MIAEPERHRWLLVSNEDIGEPGCRHWHSRPRWGILGMLFGWWRIRLSSGCPLAEGLRPPANAARLSSRSTSDGKEAPQAATAPPRGDPAAGSRRRRAGPGEAAPRRRSTTSARRRPGARFRWSSWSSWSALGMLVAGFFVVAGRAGTALLVTGLALGSLAGLELSIREHFAGYRSHTCCSPGSPGVARRWRCSSTSPISAAGGRIAVGGRLSGAPLRRR